MKRFDFLEVWWSGGQDAITSTPIHFTPIHLLLFTSDYSFLLLITPMYFSSILFTSDYSY